MGGKNWDRPSQRPAGALRGLVACIVGAAAAWPITAAAYDYHLPPYPISVASVQSVRALPVPIFSVEITGAPTRAPCRGAGFVPANGRSFAAYVQDALQSDILLAGAPAAKGHAIHGVLTQVQVSCGIFHAAWTLAMQLSVDGGAPSQIQIDHQFDSAYIGTEMASNAKDAFAPAVQDLLDAILKDSALNGPVGTDRPPPALDSGQSGTNPSAATAQQTAGPPPPSPPTPAAKQASGGPLRVRLNLIGQCAKDPDPTGIFGDDFYAKCNAADLARFQVDFATELKARGFVLVTDGGGADAALSVTLTRYVDKLNKVSDFLPGKIEIEGKADLYDTSGNLIFSQSIHHEDPDSVKPLVVEQRFAAEVVSLLAQHEPSQ